MRFVNTTFAVVPVVAVLVLSTASFAGPLVMYGGLGGHSITAGPGASANDGSLAVISDTNGSVSIVGHPAGVARISGLAFDPSGALFGTTQVAGGFPPPPGPTGASHLIRIDPDTGALIADIGFITFGGVPISIADLAVQPGTSALYGIRGPQDQLGGQGNLYTINTTTGVATFVGSTGDFFGSIAFAPNGTLYMSSADLDAMDNLVNVSLKRLNPTNAAALGTIPTADFFGSLGIRSTDGVIFGGTGDQHQLFTINPVTGAETLVGDTGLRFIGDLDFRPVPEPGTLALMAVGSGMLALLVRRRRA